MVGRMKDERSPMMGQRYWGEGGTDQSDDMSANFRQLVSTAGPGASLAHLLTRTNLLNRGAASPQQSFGLDMLEKMLMSQAGMGLQPMSQVQSRAGGGGGGGRPTWGGFGGPDYQGMADQQFMRKDAMQGVRDNAMLRDLQVRGQAIQQNGMMDQQARANDAFARLMELLPMVVRRAF